ncbi:hypothetical protein N431DRAFT_470828 [Stipitochalara longipes BDJ]|nr:hypothetical protein N431DRAFT_470828 [Stipitochalara longipes BDJ]
MASQDPNQQAPRAVLPQITWGSHIPDTSASPQVRLKYALLDLLSSNIIETATSLLGPILRFHNTQDLLLDSLRQHHRFGSTPPSIRPQIHRERFYHSLHHIRNQNSFDPDGKALIAPTEDDPAASLSAIIEFVWSFPPSTIDMSSSLGWESIVAIMRAIAHSGTSRMEVVLQIRSIT